MKTEMEKDLADKYQKVIHVILESNTFISIQDVILFLSEYCDPKTIVNTMSDLCLNSTIEFVPGVGYAGPLVDWRDIHSAKKQLEKDLKEAPIMSTRLRIQSEESRKNDRRRSRS